MKPISMLSGQNGELPIVKAGGTWLQLGCKELIAYISPFPPPTFLPPVAKSCSKVATTRIQGQHSQP
jgi:hypothetical protein